LGKLRPTASFTIAAGRFLGRDKRYARRKKGIIKTWENDLAITPRDVS
jgi:hypothetical protein